MFNHRAPTDEQRQRGELTQRRTVLGALTVACLLLGGTVLGGGIALAEQPSPDSIEQPAPDPIEQPASDPAAQPALNGMADTTLDTPADETDTQPDSQPDKAWVCKYVGTPGDGERLKAGKNPIEVSVRSTDLGWFNDAQGRSFVVQVGGDDPGVASCPAPAPDDKPDSPPWTAPVYPPFDPKPCTEYRLEKAVSSWDEATGTWSAFADWQNDGPLEWGVVPKPRTGDHGGTPGKDGHRVYAYVVVAERPATTGDCAPTPEPDPSKLRLTFIQECGVFTPLDGPWTAPATVQFRLRNDNAAPVDYVLRQAGGGVIDSGELPIGDTFVTFPFGSRTLILETYNAAGTKVHSETKAGGDTFLTTDADAVKCLPTTPEPKVDVGDWIDGVYDCDDTTVEQTRTTNTTTYVWDGTKFVGTTVATTETRTRDLAAGEIEECETAIAFPPTPPVQTPTTPTAPTTPIQTPATPNPTPAIQIPSIVGIVPPVQAVQTQGGVQQLPPTAVAAGTGLPATGSSTWSILLLAFAAIGTGSAFMVLRRRPI